MAKLTPTTWIWRDGEFIRWADAHVHVLSHSMQVGSGTVWSAMGPTGRSIRPSPTSKHAQEHRAGHPHFGFEFIADEMRSIATLERSFLDRGGTSFLPQSGSSPGPLS